MSANDLVKITERGWAGHFICADRCRFRRNTLVEHGNRRVIISTVGSMHTNDELETIGSNRYYETMAFEAHDVDGYVDANVMKRLDFKSQWAIIADHHKRLPPDVDNHANAMHEAVVAEIATQLAQEAKS